MKLVSYNVFGGRLGQDLFEYIKQLSAKTDFFCFQEIFDSPVNFEDFQNVRLKLLKELKELLPDFQGNFAPAYGGFIDMRRVDFEVWQGPAIFIRQDHRVIKTGSEFIFGDRATKIRDDFTNEPKNLQFALIEEQQEQLLIVNIHGKWHPGDKHDTQERLEQSQKILNFLKNYGCPKIVCGDFNLLPETQSIKMLEGNMRNLIKEFNINNTRNEISWTAFQNKQYFADFVFVSPEILVKNFQVPYNLFSDHLPMLLECQIRN